MNIIKSFFQGLGRHWYLKYVVACVLGVLIVGFLDENSVWAHVRNTQRIAELQAEIDVYEAAYQRDQKQLRDLQHNPKAIEKIARERYFMKMADEDVFVLSDDSPSQSSTNTPEHETAE